MLINYRKHWKNKLEIAKLYVGSGNLSRGGLQNNLEVFEQWEVVDTDKTIPAEFMIIKDYFYHLKEQQIKHCPSILSTNIDRAFSSPIFSKGQEISENSELWISPDSLIERLDIREQCHQLKIIAPYFDENCHFISRMVKRFKVSSFQVITDTRKSNLTPIGANNIKKLGGEILSLNPENEHRALHAKLYFASGEGWSWGAIGSANASVAAWNAHNAEILSVKYDGETEAIKTLIEGLSTQPLTDDDWKILEKNALDLKLEKKGEDLEALTLPQVIFAEWTSLTRIEIRLLPGGWDVSGIEFYGESHISTQDILIESTENGHIKIITTFPGDPNRLQVNMLRLLGDDEVGPWALIHDSEELSAQTRKTTPEREQLEALLGKDDFDPDAAQKILELYSSLLGERARKRQQQHEQKIAAGANTLNKELDQRPDWREVNFEGSITTPNIVEGNTNHSKAGSVLSLRMMNQLLFGGIEDDISIVDSEGESELDEDSFSDEEPATGSLKDKKGVNNDQNVTEKKEIFLQAAKLARENFINELTSFDDPISKTPDRLLDDLQILTAPLHYMLLGGGMQSSCFRTEMVHILRSFLGSNSSPYVNAINDFSSENRTELWERTSAFHLVLLLVYNACLAHLDSSAKNSKNDHGFKTVLPVLWLRHIIRTVPEETINKLDEKTANLMPRLRCGIFWLGNKYSSLEAKYPFPDFVSTMIHQTTLLDCVDQGVDDLISPLVGKGNFKEAEEEGAIAIARSRKGELGIGWIEEGRAIISNGAFQNPDGHNYYERMPRYSEQNTILISIVESSVNIEEDNMSKGLSLIKNIAP